MNVLPLFPAPRPDTASGDRRSLPGVRTVLHDPRWPRITAALMALREAGRHAVRMVDADCGAGSLLLHAAHHARTLGFTAIEARGIDRSPALIGRARVTASRYADPAIGIIFERVDLILALREEEDLPADILLCHHASMIDPRPEVASALIRAGLLIIDDDNAAPLHGMAA